MSVWLKRHAEDACLIAVAGLGGLVFNLAGVPAGWLTGAMLSVALVALWRPWQGPSLSAIDLGMLLSGTIIGSAATPEAILAASRYPGSLVLLLVCIVATMFVTSIVLVRFGRWSRLDALLASAPGALSAVMAIARDAKANLGEIAIIQFFRLFVLVAAMPSLMILSGLNEGLVPPKMQQPSWFDTGVMLLCGLGAGLVFRRMGILAPLILGSTFASMILHATDLVHGALPRPLAILAFIIVGGMVGARLGGLERRALPRLLPLAACAFAASVLMAALFAWPASELAMVSYGAAFVAFAPGGLEAMAILAVMLGFDPLYVGAHHLARFIAVGFLLPIAVKLVVSQGRDTK